MERPFFVNCNLLYYKSLQWRAFAHGDLESHTRNGTPMVTLATWADFKSKVLDKHDTKFIYREQRDPKWGLPSSWEQTGGISIGYGVPHPLSGEARKPDRDGACYFNNARNPACSKWWSPVSASSMPRSCMTRKDIQSVSDQSLSGRGPRKTLRLGQTFRYWRERCPHPVPIAAFGTGQ